MINPGFVVLRHHRPDLVDRGVREMQPSVIVLRTEHAGPDLAKQYKQWSPQSLIMAMDGPLADSLGYSTSIVSRDLRADAKQVSEVFARMVDQGWPRDTIWKPYNEPAWWNYSVRQALIEWYCYFLEIQHGYGLRSGLFHFSNSWPWANHVDTENWWPQFAPVFKLARVGQDFNVLHEYIKPDGFTLGEVPWRAYKHKTCPYNLPMIIGEFGIHGGIESDRGNIGWQATHSAEQYAEIIKQYLSNLDPRVVGVALFAADYADREWFTFDITPLIDKGLLTPQRLAGAKPLYAQPQPLPHAPVDVPWRITQRYGERPEYYRQFGNNGHNGVDFGPTVTGNTPVYAVDRGRVFRMTDSDGYGRCVRINHGWGISLYAHLDRFLVSNQQDVEAGQVIGYMGNTGNSTGKHLHWGVVKFGTFAPGMNDWIDPLPLLDASAKPAPGTTPSTPSSPPASVPVDLALTVEKARWFTEEATRALEAVGQEAQRALDLLRSEATPRLYQAEKELKHG